VALQVDTNVSEKHTVTIFRAEDGDSIYVSSKRWYLSVGPHGVTTQKTDINIITAVRASNFSQVYLLNNNKTSNV
jgi:hypothetical protein